MSIKQFVLYSSLIAAGLILLVLALNKGPLSDYHLGVQIVGILTGYVSTLVAYFLLSSNIKSKMQQFVGALGISMFLKLLAGMITVVFVATRLPDQIKVYIVAYFFSYFIFTGFEVLGLMRNLRAETENRPSE